jgi:hypothetical protein
MRGRYALLVLTLGFFSPGCIVVKDVASSVSSDTESSADARERTRNRRWAETAWQQNCTANPQRIVSPDQAQGFKDGFAEHLYSGQEKPPRSAPARYRAVEYQTPQGYRAIEDWFDGYRYGIAVAIESGCRRWIVGPGADASGKMAHAEIVAPAPMGKGDETRLIPRRMPNDAPYLVEKVNPEIRFGKPQLSGQGQPTPREMLLAPIGVEREGDLPPPAAVPPPTLGGPQAPDSVQNEAPKD